MAVDLMDSFNQTRQALQDWIGQLRQEGAAALASGRTTEAKGILAKLELAEPLIPEYDSIQSRILRVLAENEPAQSPALVDHATRQQEHTDPALIRRARESVIKTLNKQLGVRLRRVRTRTTFADDAKMTRISLMVSKYYEDKKIYWFGFHREQKEFIEPAKTGIVALTLLDENAIISLPFGVIKKYLPTLNITEDENRMYWHIHITKDADGSLHLTRKRGEEAIPLDQYLVHLS